MTNNNNNNQIKITSLDRLTSIIARFIGSWWGVLFHTTWFTVWLILSLDINTLTFAVSLEAIFIGIFLLISDNKAEAQRDRRDYAAQKRESDITERMYDLVNKQNHRNEQILTLVSGIQQSLEDHKKTKTKKQI